jgi:hypothetical protein
MIDPKMATVMTIISGMIILIYCFWQYFPFPQASAPLRCRFIGFTYKVLTSETSVALIQKRALIPYSVSDKKEFYLVPPRLLRILAIWTSTSEPPQVSYKGVLPCKLRAFMSAP